MLLEASRVFTPHWSQQTVTLKTFDNGTKTYFNMEIVYVHFKKTSDYIG